MFEKQIPRNVLPLSAVNIDKLWPYLAVQTVAQIAAITDCLHPQY